MSKGCKEEPAGRTNIRSKVLTQQIAAQLVKAARESPANHARQHSFPPLQRCESLKAMWLPSLPRLAGSKNNAVRRGKIYGS